MQPVMSLPTSTECSVLLPAVVRRSKEEAGLNGEGCGQHKPTAALGQHSNSTVVGQTNLLSSLVKFTDFQSVSEMVYTVGASLFKVDFTVRDYGLFSFQPTVPLQSA